MTMILRALPFVRFLSISLSRFLSLFSSAPERITKGKRIFREGFRDLRTDRDSYLPPISLSLLSLSLSLPGPFFFLCVISLPFSGKKRSFFLLLPTRICRCRRHQKGLAVSSKSDRQIYNQNGKVSSRMPSRHRQDDMSTFTHVYIYTHIHTYIHSPEIWKEKRRCYGQPTVLSLISRLVCVCVCEWRIDVSVGRTFFERQPPQLFSI